MCEAEKDLERLADIAPETSDWSTSDYSLQLSMSLQNFISLRCAPKALEAGGPKPSICAQLAQWAAAQRKAIRDLLTFGTPEADGSPIKAADDK
jgi:hypothetical protein